MVAALYKKSYIPDWTHGTVFSYYEPANWNSFCFTGCSSMESRCSPSTTSRPTRIRLMADNLVHLWGGVQGEKVVDWESAALNVTGLQVVWSL